MTVSSDVSVDVLVNTFSGLTLDDPLSSPILRMPNDILYHLFHSITPSDPVDKLLRTVRLSQVCKGWRSVILQAPLLWTYVDMHLTTSQKDHSEVIDTFLRRSTDFPVTFHLFVGIVVDRCGGEKLARTLSPHAHRFRALYLMVDPMVSLESPLDIIVSFNMPLLNHFDLAVNNHQRCTIFMKARPQLPETYLVAPESPTAYIDWSVRGYNLTSLSLKYLELTPATLIPILILVQGSLRHLELYDDLLVHPRNPYPCISLPNLISLRVGYRRPAVMTHFVKLLILPKLVSLSVHDFGSFPDASTPHRLRDAHFRKHIVDKDATDLLVAMCPFTAIAHLRLSGVTCPNTLLPNLLLPLQYLFQALKTLSLVLCDVDFLDALVDTTSAASPKLLENLSELTITSDNYPLVLKYLELRATRGLPRLKLLSVNPRMALLRHFYADYAESLRVVGRKKRREKAFLL